MAERRYGLIRPARLGDAATIAKILRDKGFTYLLDEALEATRARVRAGLLFSLADHHHSVLVAESAKGRAAGFVSVAWTRNLRFGVEGYLMELFVHSRFRGLGLGSCLLEAVKAEAAKRGCQRLLLLNRRDGGSYRRGFYAKHGWQERQDLALFTLQLALQP